MTDKYIAKFDDLFLSAGDMTPEERFFAVAAPDTIKDEYFAVADAVRTLIREVRDIAHSGQDTLTDEQVETVNAAYGKLVAACAPKAPVKKKATKKAASS